MSFAVSRGNISVSALQRRFKVRCRPASDMIDLLCRNGVVEKSGGWSNHEVVKTVHARQYSINFHEHQ
ncbi:hypothetical protein JYT97_03820 [Haliea sp. AH-315-K21]|nr:hypothetical protein [Haliea sp. AH-315-K21]